MTFSDKLELTSLAFSAFKTPFKENGIDDEIMKIVSSLNPKYDDFKVFILMYIEGYLRCKKENQNIIENMMNEGKSASEIFSRLVGKDYVYDEETKTRSFKE